MTICTQRNQVNLLALILFISQIAIMLLYGENVKYT